MTSCSFAGNTGWLGESDDSTFRRGVVVCLPCYPRACLHAVLTPTLPLLCAAIASTLLIFLNNGASQGNSFRLALQDTDVVNNTGVGIPPVRWVGFMSQLYVGSAGSRFVGVYTAAFVGQFLAFHVTMDAFTVRDNNGPCLFTGNPCVVCPPP